MCVGALHVHYENSTNGVDNWSLSLVYVLDIFKLTFFAEAIDFDGIFTFDICATDYLCNEYHDSHLFRFS